MQRIIGLWRNWNLIRVNSFSFSFFIVDQTKREDNASSLCAHFPNFVCTKMYLKRRDSWGNNCREDDPFERGKRTCFAAHNYLGFTVFD